MIAIPIWLILIVLGLLFFKTEKKSIHEEIMQTRTYFDFKSKTKADEKYYSRMIEILSAYSKMKRPERITYIKENKRVAELVSRGPFQVPSIGILETSLDPRGKHGFGEEGIHGIKLNTAKYAEFINRNYMPSHIASKMRVRIRSKKDLRDIKTQIRVTYILLWWFDQCYNGSDMWSISVYHWGGFIAKYWKSDKDVPASFTLNGIKYGVMNYYLAWKELVTCFEKGELEPIANIYSRYKKNKKKLHRREIEYRKLKRLFKGADKKVNNLEKDIDLLKKDVKEYREYKKWAEKELYKIGADARKGKAKGMIPRIKQLARDWLKKLKKK